MQSGYIYFALEQTGGIHILLETRTLRQAIKSQEVLLALLFVNVEIRSLAERSENRYIKQLARAIDGRYNVKYRLRVARSLSMNVQRAFLLLRVFHDH